jgi:hypothetical protein
MAGRRDMRERYDIEKITDIFQIPEDKFEEFLVDFKTYYELGKAMMELIPAVSNTSGIKADARVVPQKMTWIDDGKHDANIKFATSPHPPEDNGGEK